MRPHHLSQQSARIPILYYRIFEMLMVIEKDSILGLMQGFLQQETPRVVGGHRNHTNGKRNSLEGETSEKMIECMKIIKGQRSRSWVRAANMERQCNSAPQAQGHAFTEYIRSLPYGQMHWGLYSKAGSQLVEAAY